MLTEEEWTQIFDILDAVKDSDISLLGKMTQIAMMGKKMLDNIAES